MIYRPIPRRTPKRRRSPRRILLCSIGALVAVLVLINGLLIFIYYHKALPHARLGRMDVGGMSYASLARISPDDVLPSNLTIQKGSAHATFSPSKLGLSIDVPASVRNVSTWQRWFPLLSLVLREGIPLHTHLDNSAYDRATASLAQTFSVSALPRHIAFSGSTFIIAPPSSGRTLDTAALRSALTNAVDAGSDHVTAPTQTIPAPDSTDDLTPQLLILQKQLATKIAFEYKSQHLEPPVQDIGRWYTASGSSMELSTERITAYLTSTVNQRYRITIANPYDLTKAIEYALGKNMPITLAVTPQTSSTVVRTYCTAVRGVSGGVLDELIGKLAATYNDIRGWNNNGQIAFKHTDSGCQYTVWMSAPSQMSTFGAICDDYYNCQVGSNVVLNYDRWTSATDPWNATHGTIEDYRILMIDHETGHRLGFLDNPTCPGPGQSAPVMMQQSIDLKGCVFNIWPLASELTRLDTSLGLPVAASASD